MMTQCKILRKNTVTGFAFQAKKKRLIANESLKTFVSENVISGYWELIGY